MAIKGPQTDGHVQFYDRLHRIVRGWEANKKDDRARRPEQNRHQGPTMLGALFDLLKSPLALAAGFLFVPIGDWLYANHIEQYAGDGLDGLLTGQIFQYVTYALCALLLMLILGLWGTVLRLLFIAGFCVFLFMPDEIFRLQPDWTRIVYPDYLTAEEQAAKAEAEAAAKAAEETSE